MNLRAKLFLILSTLSTIPLLILTLFSYQRYVQTTYQRMDDFSSHLFENALEQSNQTLNQISDISLSFNFYYKDGFSMIQELDRYSDKDEPPTVFDYYQTYKVLGRTCQSLLLADSRIYGIFIVTPSGYVFDYTNNQNGTIPPGYHFEEDTEYQSIPALDGGYYVSPVADHPLFTGKEPSVFFGQCLKDVYSHKLVGILLVDCDPEMFDLSPLNSMPDVALLTIDNKDTADVLYTSYRDRVNEFSTRNIRTSQSDLKLSPLRLVMTVDYAMLFREFNVTGILLILIGAISILALIIVSFFISGYIVRPIGHLSRKMASQTGHTLIQSTRYLNRTDEIGTLYNEYNAMVESLNLAVKQDYHDKLVLLDAQMKSLESRINSHFLFNTLEAINSMAELDENEEIAVMSQALGNLFRYSLKTQSELVLVADELNHVNDYVTIQQLRFDHRFSLVVDMSDSFRQLKVLKLILQPLVENALYHGLNYCTCGDTITITGKTEGTNIYIDVHDNGQGMEPETLEALQKSLHEEASFTELGHRNKQSIGLKNIHSRIELYYGRGYGLTVTSLQHSWTNIRIHLPLLGKETV